MEVVSTVSDIDDVGWLADTVAADLTLDQKQIILELENISDRLQKLIGFIESELDI